MLTFGSRGWEAAGTTGWCGGAAQGWGWGRQLQAPPLIPLLSPSPAGLSSSLRG